MTEENHLRASDVLDGKYRIEGRVGQGGMGAVYRGIHLHTTRTVAIKVIRPHLTSREEFVERFRREAEAAGRLRHPNVVDVTDFGFAATAGGRVAYLVMEFLDGCTLSDVLAEEKRLPVSWAVDIVEQVSSALDEAHAQGIVHRDLKPENIWLEPNRRGGYTVKVLDFGLVKLGDIAEPAAFRLKAEPADDFRPKAEPRDVRDGATETEATEAETIAETPTIASDVLTRLGSLTGTPMYMSPEQCRGDQVDGRSDIYSLGVIAYRMLSGQTPFVGDVTTLIRGHLTESPPPLHTRVRNVPRAVSDLVMSALAKEPAERPPRAGGFASALRAAAEGSGTLLRQAIALYSERFPVLLRLSALAYIPMFLFLSGLAVLDTRGGGSSPAVSVAIILGMIAMNVGSYLAIPALVAPVVFQAIVAPLRPASVSDAWAAVRRRWKALIVATVFVLAVTAAWSLLLIVPGADRGNRVCAVCTGRHHGGYPRARCASAGTTARASGLEHGPDHHHPSVRAAGAGVVRRGRCRFRLPARRELAAERAALPNWGVVVVGDVSAPRRVRGAADGNHDRVAVSEVATGRRRAVAGGR